VLVGCRSDEWIIPELEGCKISEVRKTSSGGMFSPRVHVSFAIFLWR
jgi:hypothetical protein